MTKFNVTRAELLNVMTAPIQTDVDSFRFTPKEKQRFQIDITKDEVRIFKFWYRAKKFWFVATVENFDVAIKNIKRGAYKSFFDESSTGYVAPKSDKKVVKKTTNQTKKTTKKTTKKATTKSPAIVNGRAVKVIKKNV